MRYALRPAYNGTSYSGWQWQPNAGNTVQAEIEQALKTVAGSALPVTGCGRTDTGVHASDFFAHVDTDEEFPARITDALNSLLPPDIAIRKVTKVSDDFHARFTAVARTYHYHIHFQKDPFLHLRSWLCKWPLDIAAMNAAAAQLIGKKDFRSFCKSGHDVTNYLCDVQVCEWKEVHGGLVFEVRANRFLRNMVRAMVGTLVAVGRGKMKPEEMDNVLAEMDRSEAGPSVPACGLFLSRIDYPQEYKDIY